MLYFCEILKFCSTLKILNERKFLCNNNKLLNKNWSTTQNLIFSINSNFLYETSTSIILDWKKLFFQIHLQFLHFKRRIFLQQKYFNLRKVKIFDHKKIRICRFKNLEWIWFFFYQNLNITEVGVSYKKLKFLKKMNFQ